MDWYEEDFAIMWESNIWAQEFYFQYPLFIDVF